MDLQSGQERSPAADPVDPGISGHSNLADAWLGRLWPLAVLLHLAGNGRNLEAMDHVGVLQLLMIGLSIWQLTRPGAISAGLLAATYLSVLWLKLPVVGNHEIVLGLIALAVLPSVCLAGADWARSAGRIGRWILLLAYGFMALSKLNRGFFDVVSSCALVFADDFAAFGGLRPSQSPLAGTVVIAATVAIEAAIPILLLRSRLRFYGVVVALAFHFVLALDPTSHVWDFSATLLPLFLLFAPLELRVWLDRAVTAADRRPLTERVLILVLIVAAHGAVAFGAPLPLVPTWLVAYAVWLLIAAATLAVAVTFLRRHPDATDSNALVGAKGSFAGRPLWFSVCMATVLSLTVVNGLSPYLELRSAAAFNMYSNLRIIDGESNHLLVNWARPDDSLSSYVGIETVDDGSPLAYYRDGALLVPTENLQRYLMAHPTENPTLRHGGRSASAHALGFGVADGDHGPGSGFGDLLKRKLGFRRGVPDPFGPSAAGGDDCLRQWGPIG